MRPIRALPRLAALPLAAAFAGIAAPALAHTGHGAEGLVHGFAHPIGGFDHLLAMLAVGLLGAAAGARGYLAPIGFVAGMVLGASLGFAGLGLPAVEVLIAGSVVAIGLLVAFGRRLPVEALAGLAAVFALFHGHAHAAEAPVDASGLAYVAGFVVATALLHAFGFAAGRFLSGPAAARIITGAGLATAATGVVLTAGVL